MKDRRKEIIGILLIVSSLFVLLSLFTYNSAEEPSISQHVAISNRMGILGVYVSHALIKMTIGYVAYVIPLLGLLWGWWVFSKKSYDTVIRLSIHGLALALILSVALGLPAAVRGITGSTSYQSAGLVGALLARLLHDFLGTIGASLVLLAGTLVLIRGYFNWKFYHPFEMASASLKTVLRKRDSKVTEKEKEKEKREHTADLLTKLQQKKREEEFLDETVQGFEEAQEEPPSAPESEQPVQPLSVPIEPPEESVEVEGKDAAQIEMGMAETPGPGKSGSFTIGEEVIEEEVDLDAQTERVPKREYQLPSVDILDRHEQIVIPSASHEELVEKANFLVQSLMTFGVEGKVVNISPGPIITLFEVEPAEGVRVNKFVQLADDLARVLKAPRVRVIAPIPGKSSVGIEIPNQNPSIVYLRSVINSEKFVSSDSKLAVALGKTTSGENFVIELEKMPHLMVAGTTGSGKSVCINTIITSILYRATPEDVRFILIDPKKVELASYRSVEKHHLITSDDIDEYVITTPENAILSLRAAEREMNRRYDVLADAVVRNIQEYNEKAVQSDDLPVMPYIVVLIDELADLMLRAPKEVEIPIARLAQMARAVGIHLVVATQRPSVDVITGVIKANFPARIAFQVATKIDSRTIIDTNGAEKLLGKGDMLFLPPGSSDPIRIHNSFVSLEEINRLVSHVESQPTADEITLEGSKVQLTEDGGLGGPATGEDELLKDAIRLAVTHQQGSISLLQRRFRIGYSRAARLIDEMEQLGIVGAFTGSKAREVLVDESYLQVLDDDSA